MYTLIFLLIAFFVLIPLLFGVSIVGTILRAIFGTGRRHSSRRETSSYGNRQQSADSSTNATTESNKKKREKIFDKNEGEYVDFEEIKE